MLRLMVTTAAVGGIWAAASGEPERTAGLDVYQMEGRAYVWRLAGDDAKGGCRFALRDDGRSDHFRIDLEGACDDLPPLLAGTARWGEDAFGNVTLLDTQGNRLAEFGAAEFDGLISVWPRSADLALVPAQ